jgi:hypothetical protein
MIFFSVADPDHCIIKKHEIFRFDGLSEDRSNGIYQGRGTMHSLTAEPGLSIIWHYYIIFDYLKLKVKNCFHEKKG